MLDLDEVRATLNRIADPCSIATGIPIGLVDMGLVRDISMRGGSVRIILRVTSPTCWQATNILAKVEEEVLKIPGVEAVDCAMDAWGEWVPEMMAPEARASLRRLRSASTTRE